MATCLGLACTGLNRPFATVLYKGDSVIVFVRWVGGKLQAAVGSCTVQAGVFLLPGTSQP